MQYINTMCLQHSSNIFYDFIFLEMHYLYKNFLYFRPSSSTWKVYSWRAYKKHRKNHSCRKTILCKFAYLFMVSFFPLLNSIHVIFQLQTCAYCQHQSSRKDTLLRHITTKHYNNKCFVSKRVVIVFLYGLFKIIVFKHCLFHNLNDEKNHSFLGV